MTGHVYVMRSASGPIKIGRSAIPHERLKTIQSSNAAAIELCHISEERADAASIENVAHRLLETKRLAGEWFDVSVYEAVAAIEAAIRQVESSTISGTGQFSMRVTPRLKEDIHELSAAAGISPASYVEMILRKHVEAEKKRK